MHFPLLRFALFLLFAMPSSFASGQLIIAHRGASYDAPENTLAAFKLAWEQGADGVEGDFYLTSDGHIVCIHDKGTKRTTDKNLVVADSTLAELRRLDAGSWKDKKWSGEKIPTFEEVLAIIPKGKKFYIELKTGPEIVEPLVRALAKSTVPSEQLVIICFNQDAMAACSKQLPHIKTQWLTGYKENKKKSNKLEPTIDEVIATIRKTGATGLGSQAEKKHVDAAFIQKLHAAGIEEIGVWTVDEIKLASFYREQKVTAITTNRPGWLRKGLERQSNANASSGGE